VRSYWCNNCLVSVPIKSPLDVARVSRWRHLAPTSLPHEDPSTGDSSKFTPTKKRTRIRGEVREWGGGTGSRKEQGREGEGRGGKRGWWVNSVRLAMSVSMAIKTLSSLQVGMCGQHWCNCQRRLIIRHVNGGGLLVPSTDQVTNRIVVCQWDSLCLWKGT
jgi:hypothetical protein